MSTRASDPDRLPYVTSGPGIGGRIKREPRHFVVEEIPLYEPSGAGEHVYLRLRREGRTTREVVDALARIFGIRARDVGCAGQKDKRARATQAFSVPLPGIDPGEAARRVVDDLGFDVLAAARHGNKLRRGHLLGNCFDILVEDVHVDALARSADIARELVLRGLPNFYGPQRFGADGANAERGRALLARPRADWRSRLMLSAFQARLFNAWLVERLRRGSFEEVWLGDVGKRLDNGALFDVEDPAAENARMARREITYTGPIYGARGRAAAGSPGALEREILDRFEVQESDFARARLDGSRRAARLFVDDLEIVAEGAESSGLRVRVSLPKGAYATTLLGELMKTEDPLLSIDEEE